MVSAVILRTNNAWKTNSSYVKTVNAYFRYLLVLILVLNRAADDQYVWFLVFNDDSQMTTISSTQLEELDIAKYSRVRN